MTSVLITQSILLSASEAIAARLDDTGEDPALFLSQYHVAIAQAKNLERVWPQFVLWLLKDPEFGIAKYATHPSESTGVSGVESLYEKALRGQTIRLKEWQDTLAIEQSNPINNAVDGCMPDSVVGAAAAAVGVMLHCAQDGPPPSRPLHTLVEDVIFYQAECLSLTDKPLAAVSLAQKNIFLTLIAS